MACGAVAAERRQRRLYSIIGGRLVLFSLIKEGGFIAMNLHQPDSNEALQTKNRSRNVAPHMGGRSRCVDGCKGNCDLFKATFRGREMLYPSLSVKSRPAPTRTIRSIIPT